jgi:protein-tyrosine phosphatase
VSLNQITENIFIGNSHAALHSRDLLKSLGITAILNVAKDLDNNKLDPQEFSLNKIGLGDGDGNDLEDIGTALQVLQKLLLNGHKVLVHCHEGKSRSVGLVATYIHLKRPAQFNSLDEAEEYIRGHRPIAKINAGLKQDYQKVIDLLTDCKSEI